MPSNLCTGAAVGTFVVKGLVMSALGGLMFSGYLWIGRHPRGELNVLEMPDWVIFSPAWLIPYLGLLGVTCWLPATIRDGSLFRACLRANLWAWLLVMPWWWLVPATLPRPPLPAGFWSGWFQTLWGFDPPHNIMPCAHATGPVVAAWFAGRDHPTWRWPLALTVGSSLPSIALVWQHRPADILLGIAAAGVGIAIAEKLGFGIVRHPREPKFVG